jgi:alkylhydroperoxidase family enzyme
VAVAARGASVQTTPRILPLPEAQWTTEIRVVFTSLGQSGPATNDFKTLARHPGLLKSVMPFAAYIASGSELPPRDRELLILRTAWLCRADYVWAQHAPIAEPYGIGRPERRRIAKGPIGWDAFDRTLIRAADELHDSSFITDQTWNALAARYDRRQTLDALFTISGFTMLAGAMNTLGVQPDEHLRERLPTDATRQRTVTPLKDSDIRLPQPRIPPLTAAELTPETRGILDPSNSGRLGDTAATYGHHVKLYQPRQILSDGPTTGNSTDLAEGSPVTG